MARNKRKNVKDKDRIKQIRKETRKRWRNKKANEKAMKNVKKEAIAGLHCAKESNQAAESSGKTALTNQEPPKPRVVLQRHVKEIDPSLLVKSEKFLGSGTFGNCYLAYYRDVVVTVKEYKKGKCSLDYLKREVRHEAKMINHLEDHRGVPLLFGIVTKSEPFRLITKFHGIKQKSFTLQSLIKKKKLDKPTWLFILKNLVDALDHIHSCGILHNDLKCNNVVLEYRDQQWNPVIIDFGKARFISDPKPVLLMKAEKQEGYRQKFPHIAPEIVNGSDRQSIYSDIYSMGKIVLAVLDLLPTATAKSIKVAKSAICEEPTKRPTLKELSVAL
ncbi:hypothetical protein ACROYT_G044578 [Oculina patagonica]